MNLYLKFSLVPALFTAASLSVSTQAAGDEPGGAGCEAIPTAQGVYTSLTQALDAVVDPPGNNAGFGNDMWATIVDRNGIVCAVTFSGEEFGDQWVGSRAISAQKANTANSFSLTGFYPNLPDVGRSLASGNLYGLAQPGGSLFGLQFSNPVDPRVAYGDNAKKDGTDTTRPPDYGTQSDPMVGTYIGGVNVFGGGLTLYDEEGNVVGGLGVSGDTSCTDHITAWRVRDELGLDNIPGGVAPGGPNGTDNLILADPVTPNTFEHPVCGFGEEEIIPDLPNSTPIGE